MMAPNKTAGAQRQTVDDEAEHVTPMEIDEVDELQFVDGVGDETERQCAAAAAASSSSTVDVLLTQSNPPSALVRPSVSRKRCGSPVCCQPRACPAAASATQRSPFTAGEHVVHEIAPQVLFNIIEQYLSLEDWGSLSQTNSNWQQSVSAVLDGDEARMLMRNLQVCIPELRSWLLDRDLDVTHGSNRTLLLHQLWAVIFWLNLQQNQPWGFALAATAGLVEDISRLFTVQKLPDTIAAHFVQHMGLLITYEQLLAAARLGVAGVEVWVQIQHKCSIQTNIPDMALALCCGSPNQESVALSQVTSSQDIEDLLQLATCIVDQGVAYSVAIQLVPQIADATVLLSVLHTAVKRGCLSVLRAVTQSAAESIAAQIDADAVLQLLAMTAAENTFHSNLVQQQLCMLPAAATITYMQLLSLMWQMVYANSTLIEELSQLPAALELSGDDMAQLLWTAIQRRNIVNVQRMCKLPAVVRLNDDSLTRLLIEAVSANDDFMVSALSGVVYQVRIKAWQLHWVLQTALQQRNQTGEMLRLLCHLIPDDFATHLIMEYLRAAVDIENVVGVHSLTQLPSADAIDSRGAMQLLQAAIEKRNSSVISCLGQLLIVRQLPADKWQALKGTAQQGGNRRVLATMLQLSEEAGRLS